MSQIEAKLAAGEIDCISIEPSTSDSTTAIINKLMEQGIPVFTAGVTSRGHEFTNFTQVPMLEGQTAGKIVLDWMKANGKDLKVFAVSGGDPTQFWAQGRMQGFVETIKAAIPDADLRHDATRTASMSATIPARPMMRIVRSSRRIPTCSSSRTSTSAPSTPIARSKA